MILLSAQPFELMMLMTMVLVVMVELMKVTNSDAGVNKKPFACPFQDRQFQNSD